MRLSIIAAAVVVLGLCSGAVAQTSIEKFQRQMDLVQQDQRVGAYSRLPIGDRTYFDYGGSLSFGYYSIDDAQGDNHGLKTYDIGAYAHLSVDNIHEFFVRVDAQYRQFNPGDSFNGTSDYYWYQLYLERAFYKFDLQRYLGVQKHKSVDWDVQVVLGRQLFNWANGLVLSWISDGGQVLITTSKMDITVLAGVTAEHTTDIDASRPGFENHTQRGFFGGMVGWKVTPRHRIFAYGLVQEDYNPEETLIIGPTTTNFNYNSWYVAVGANGNIGERWQYGIEAVYEGGSGLSNSFDGINPVPQTEEEISAWAADVRLDYLFNDRNRTRMVFEFIIASGDPDRLQSTNTFGGNLTGTKDLGFNGFGLVNTGLAFAPAVSNLIALRIGASSYPFIGFKPLKRLQIGGEFYAYFKCRADGGFSEPTTNNSYLGVEPDVYVNWQITSDVALSVRYGVFFPGEAIASTKAARQFFYVGVTWGF